jgi:hypothetical protein
MSSSVSVQYFDGRGRGEVIRLMLAQCGVEFKDDRIKENDDYKALKKGKYCHIFIRNYANMLQTHHSVNGRC